MNYNYIFYFLLLVAIGILSYFVVKKSNDNTSLQKKVNALTGQVNSMKVPPKNVITDIFTNIDTLTVEQIQCATNYITSNYTIAQMISWINQLTPKLKNIPASAKPYIINIDDAIKAVGTSCHFQ